MINKRTFIAAFEYYQRKKYEEKPDGTYDRGGRWYPNESERCSCCEDIKEPSTTWPYSLLNHCRSSKHIVIKYGIDKKDFNKCLKECAELFEMEWDLGLTKIIEKLPENFKESDIIESFVESKL